MKNLNTYINETLACSHNEHINEFRYDGNKHHTQTQPLIQLKQGGWNPYLKESTVDYAIVFPEGLIELFSESGLKDRIQEFESLDPKSPNNFPNSEYIDASCEQTKELYIKLLSIKKYNEWVALDEFDSIDDGGVLNTPIGIKYKK